MDDPQLNSQKSTEIAAFLAFLGAIQPTPLPLAGIHKFYLGQYGWGVTYLVLGITQVPRIACAAESMWYLANILRQKLADKMGVLPPAAAPPLNETVEGIAKSLREIEHLRQEGLLSDYEFEQKRRRLLEKMP